MGVNATAIWRIRPSGNDANGGGYDSGIAGAATDYSQQNAAQASGTHGVGSGTTTFTDTTAAAFTSAMIGNAINIAGQGFYFVVAFIDASHVTVDRGLGTFSGASWSLGGGWAGFANAASTGPLVAGNKVRVLGSGTPNPSSYTYDYVISGAITLADGDVTNGRIVFENDPSTPGYIAPPNANGGMPVIKWNTSAVIFPSCSYVTFAGLYFVAAVAAGGNGAIEANNGQLSPVLLCGCIFDQFGFDNYFTNNGPFDVMGGEYFSSVPASGGASGALFFASGVSCYVAGVNVHDTVGIGIQIFSDIEVTVMQSIIAKCGGDGIQQNASGQLRAVIGCTIDANAGNGINYAAAPPLGGLFFNNIITNHTQPGTAGLMLSGQSLTAAQAGRLWELADFNVWYGNTTDISGATFTGSGGHGPHDTTGGSNPYVAQATENYTLA